MSPAEMRSSSLSIVPRLPVGPAQDVDDADIQAIYRSVVEHSRDGFLVVDDHGEIVFANPAAAGMFGMSAEELVGRNFGFPIDKDCKSAPIELVRAGCTEPVFADMAASATTWQGRPASLIALSDMTVDRARETELLIHAAAMETAASGMFITDLAGKIRWVNAAYERITGYSRNELVGMKVDALHYEQPSKIVLDKMGDRLAAGQSWTGRLINRRKNGEHYTVEQTTTPIPDALGRVSHFVSVQEDISERLRAQDEMIRLAKYDTLTGLPNRSQFTDRVKTALDRANRAGAAVAVAVMDLDNFKAVNNTLGHATGDALVAAVAARVQKLMRTTDTLARLGGDDFGILLEMVTDMAAASRTLRRILECFREPVTVDGHVLKIGASLGIAAYPRDDTDPAALLRQAELAMYRAKAEGGQTFKYFDRDMDADIRRRVRLEADLRRAIDNRELWLAYQPQLDLAARRIVGAEALIRWNHPERGVVSPGEFIPLAESSGLILPIGDWIIEEICRQSMLFTEAGLEGLQLGFNVSGVQFRQRDLFEQVTSSLQRSGTPKECLDIEITETVAMERTNRVQQNVDRLREAGISISMDDFGTGYSSLSNLQAFPVQRLKVDASFVRGIGANRDDEKIVEAVVRLGQSLGLKVIAEGVETEQQMSFLKDRDCDEIQGFLISKPLTPGAFCRFVKDFHR